MRNTVVFNFGSALCNEVAIDSKMGVDFLGLFQKEKTLLPQNLIRYFLTHSRGEALFHS